MSHAKQVVRQVTTVLVGGVVFAASFMGAFHDPRPHAMPVAVAATPAELAQLRAATAAHAPGALSLRAVPDAPAAAAAVRDRRVDGGLVLAAGRAEVLTAAAAGSQTVATLQRAFTAQALRRPVVTRDLVPLPSGDRAGLAPFFFVLTLVVPSMLLAVAMTLLLGHLPGAVRLAGAATFAIVLGLLDATLADPVYGALGGFGRLAGLGMLTAFAASATTLGLGRLLGPLGVALAALVLVVVGVPASGAALGPAFVPGLFRALHPILPPGAALDAVRNAVYFGGHATWGRVAVLAGWAAAGVAAVFVGGRWSLPAARAGRHRGPGTDTPRSAATA